MRENPAGLKSPQIDESLVAAHPELAVLTLNLPMSDGEPMETHRAWLQAHLILATLHQHWRDREDWFAGANLFLYYCVEQAQQIIAEEAEPTRPRRAFRGPDVFVVQNIDGRVPRDMWVVWNEGGRYPDVIFECLSPSTRLNDLTTKKELYERVFRTPEYYVFDPYDPRILLGWQLTTARGYQPVSPDDRGWLWSPTFELWLGRWEGIFERYPATWIRFFDQEGQLVLTIDEAAERRMQAAEQHAQAAEQHAQVSARQAQAAEQRAAAAEAEAVRLRAELARLRGETS